MKPSNPPNPQDLYTVPEIAGICKTSTRTVRRWIKNGDLIAHRIGGLIRITSADFDTFLKIRRMA